VKAAALLLLAAAMGCSGAQITGATAHGVPYVAKNSPGGARPMRIALATFSELEKRFDGKISSLGGVNQPMDLLGTTRGIYLDGYGAVFTSELSLIITPDINPFRPTITDKLKTQVHQEKVARVPLLKEAMKEMLRAAAMTLIQVPEDQQIVLAVRLDYLKWEDTMGLPGLIVMKADRKAALAGDFQTEEQ
jgi:hypothetical protein